MVIRFIILMTILYTVNYLQFNYLDKKAHQKIGLMEKINPIKLYTKVKKA